jgi:glycosyltransferase involved in cell wall biosynthesis
MESLLDSLCDQVTRLEVILIDDGSADDTAEVVFGIVERYPQVKALYHDTPRGWQKSVERGLALATGEMLLIHEENCRLSIDLASRLFTAAEHGPLVLGTVRPIRWPHRWIGWRQGEVCGGFRLIVPAKLEEYGHAVESISHLATRKIKESDGWRVVPIADNPAGAGEQFNEGRYYHRSDAHRSAAPGRLPITHHPNFLHQIRDFALGE